MKAIDETGITFANVVIGRGIFHNIVNITLAAFQFSPTEKEVDPDLVITARLRLDRPCAKQLHEALGELLGMVEKQEAAAKSTKTNGVERVEDTLN